MSMKAKYFKVSFNLQSSNVSKPVQHSPHFSMNKDEKKKFEHFFDEHF